MKARPTEIVIPVRVEISEIDLAGLDRDAVFDFIVALDLRIADYEFTERLRDHFTAEIAKEDAAG